MIGPSLVLRAAWTGLLLALVPTLDSGSGYARSIGAEMARACEIGAHKEGNVPRMPGMPETTSRPRNPDEDEFVHCTGPDGSDDAPTFQQERTSPRRIRPQTGQSLDASKVVLP